MPLPIAHGLLGAAVVAAVYTPAARDWRLLLLGAALANCPDLDFALLYFLNWRGIHRGFTHSVLFSAVGGYAIWLALGRAHRRLALAFAFALLSHTLLDFGTSEFGGGVMLLWPFTWERFKLGVVSFSEYPNGLQIAEVLRGCLMEAVVFAPLLLVVLLVTRRSVTSVDQDGT